MSLLVFQRIHPRKLRCTLRAVYVLGCRAVELNQKTDINTYFQIFESSVRYCYNATSIEFSMAYNGMGWIKATQEQWDEAISYFSASTNSLQLLSAPQLLLATHYPEVCKASVFCRQGLFDKAIATLDHFTEWPQNTGKPPNLQECKNLIRCAEVSALFVVVLLINITSLARASLVRGDSLAHQGEHEASMESYVRALERYQTAVGGKRHPWIADVQIKIASLLHQSGKPDESRLVFNMSVSPLNLH